MIELVIGGIAIGAALSGTTIGAALGRRFAPEKVVVKEVESDKVKCPYCHTEITGFDELDSINHVMCINRSEHDVAVLLEKERHRTAQLEAANQKRVDDEVARLTKIRDDIQRQREEFHAEQSEAAKQPKKKNLWLLNIDTVWATQVPNGQKPYWNVNEDKTLYFRYQWEVFMNGERKQYGYTRTEEGAEDTGQKALTVWQHKHGEGHEEDEVTDE